MIKPSKFSMQFNGGLVVSERGFFGGREESEKVADAVGLDSSTVWPIWIPSIHMNALVASCIVGPCFGVHSVLGSGCESEIVSPVVEVVSVDMVNPSVGRCIHNDASHIKLNALFINRDHPSRPALFSEIPLPLAKPIEVGIIDNSKLSFGQRYFPHDPILSEMAKSPRRD